MSNKSSKTKRSQPTGQSTPYHDNQGSTRVLWTTIIVAIIGAIGVIIAAAFAYWGNQNTVYGPIHATETAQSFYLTQSGPALNSNPHLVATLTLTTKETNVSFLEPEITETITPYPLPSINVITPTQNDLKIVPTMYVGYLDIKTPYTQTYKANISSKVTYLWTYQWCAKHTGTLNENLSQIEFSFFIDDIQIPDSKFLIFKEPSRINGWPCQRWTTMLSGWNNQQASTLSIAYYIPTPLSDGVTTYPIGEYRHDITFSFID